MAGCLLDAMIRDTVMHAVDGDYVVDSSLKLARCGYLLVLMVTEHK